MTNARRALLLRKMERWDAFDRRVERGAQHPRIHTARVYTAIRKHVNSADGHDSSAVQRYRRRH